MQWQGIKRLKIATASKSNKDIESSRTTRRISTDIYWPTWIVLPTIYLEYSLRPFDSIGITLKTIAQHYSRKVWLFWQSENLASSALFLIVTIKMKTWGSGNFWIEEYGSSLRQKFSEKLACIHLFSPRLSLALSDYLHWDNYNEIQCFHPAQVYFCSLTNRQVWRR